MAKSQLCSKDGALLQGRRSSLPLHTCSSARCQPLAPPGSTLPSAQPAWHCLLLCSCASVQELGSPGCPGRKNYVNISGQESDGGCRSGPCSGISEPKLSVKDEMSLLHRVLTSHLGSRATGGLSFTVSVLDCHHAKAGFGTLASLAESRDAAPEPTAVLFV